MIKELCDRHMVPCVFTSKLFWGTFTSSLTVNFPQEAREAYEAALIANNVAYNDKKITLTEKAKGIKAADAIYDPVRADFIASLVALIPNVDYRQNKVSVTLYSNDPTAFAAFISARSAEVVKVVVPRNEQEIAFLRVNTGKIVRDKYWIDAFPYKITYKAQPDNKNQYLREYVVRNFGPDVADGRTVDHEVAHYYDCSTAHILYLKEFQDLFLTKIGTMEMIDKIEEIVLSTDV